MRSSRLISATFGLGGLLSVVAAQACSGTATDSPASGGSAPSGGALTSSGGALTSSGGAAPAGGAAAGGAPVCDTAVFLKGCSATTCHGSADGSKPPTVSDLDLYAPGLEGRIYNVPTTYKGVDMSRAANPTACPSPAQLLLDPAGLETSLMWLKVTEGHSCGDKMPSSGSFDAGKTACYKAWLEDIIAHPPK